MYSILYALPCLTEFTLDDNESTRILIWFEALDGEYVQNDKFADVQSFVIVIQGSVNINTEIKSQYAELNDSSILFPFFKGNCNMAD